MRTKLLLLLFFCCSSCFSQYYKRYELTEDSYQGIEYIHGFRKNGIPSYRGVELKTGNYVYGRKQSNYRDQDAGYNPAYYKIGLPDYKFKGKNELIDFLADLLGESIPDYEKEDYYGNRLFFKTYFNIRGEILEISFFIGYPKKEVFPQGEYISLENYYKIEQFILKNCKWSFIPNLSIDGAKFLTSGFHINLFDIHDRWIEKNKKETE